MTKPLPARHGVKLDRKPKLTRTGDRRCRAARRTVQLHARSRNYNIPHSAILRLTT